MQSSNGPGGLPLAVLILSLSLIWFGLVALWSPRGAAYT